LGSIAMGPFFSEGPRICLGLQPLGGHRVPPLRVTIPINRDRHYAVGDFPLTPVPWPVPRHGQAFSSPTRGEEMERARFEIVPTLGEQARPYAVSTQAEAPKESDASSESCRTCGYLKTSLSGGLHNSLFFKELYGGGDMVEG